MSSEKASLRWFQWQLHKTFKEGRLEIPSRRWRGKETSQPIQHQPSTVNTATEILQMLLSFFSVESLQAPRQPTPNHGSRGKYRLRFPKAHKYKQMAWSWAWKGHLFTAQPETRRQCRLVEPRLRTGGSTHSWVCCSARAHKCPLKGLQKQFEVGRQNCKYKIHK